MSGKWPVAAVVSATQAVYGELNGFSRDDVKNFTRLGDAADLGSPGDGPRGARLFTEEEVVAIVALLPWVASLGGVEGRLGWVARCRQLLRRTRDVDRHPCLEIRPARLGIPRDPTVAPERRLTDLYPNAIHIDLGRIRQAVRVALGGGSEGE